MIDIFKKTYNKIYIKNIIKKKAKIFTELQRSNEKYS